jgi:hypothetical protein
VIGRRRPHGSGAIYRRGDGRWEAVISLPSDVTTDVVERLEQSLESEEQTP